MKSRNLKNSFRLILYDFFSEKDAQISVDRTLWEPMGPGAEKWDLTTQNRLRPGGFQKVTIQVTYI